MTSTRRRTRRTPGTPWTGPAPCRAGRLGGDRRGRRLLVAGRQDDPVHARRRRRHRRASGPGGGRRAGRPGAPPATHHRRSSGRDGRGGGGRRRHDPREAGRPVVPPLGGAGRGRGRDGALQPLQWRTDDPPHLQLPLRLPGPVARRQGRWSSSAGWPSEPGSCGREPGRGSHRLDAAVGVGLAAGTPGRIGWPHRVAPNRRGRCRPAARSARWRPSSSGRGWAGTSSPAELRGEPRNQTGPPRSALFGPTGRPESQHRRERSG